MSRYPLSNEPGVFIQLARKIVYVQLCSSSQAKLTIPEARCNKLRDVSTFFPLSQFEKHESEEQTREFPNDDLPLICDERLFENRLRF